MTDEGRDGESGDRAKSPAYRGPLQGLAELSEVLGREQPRLATFIRGAVIGALVGAAIAGSAIWRRRRTRGRGRQGAED